MGAERRTSTPALEAHGLAFAYAAGNGSIARVVDNVSFTLDAGERLVILGPSGCGKSRILKGIAGFMDAACGTLSIDGKAIVGPGPDRVVVFQEFDQLLPWKTVRENVMFPLRIARKLSKAEAEKQAEEALAAVGLTQAVDLYPHALSGGMKQRTAIARALAARPDVLLMDEPFASLDALTRRALQKDLLRLAKERNFTLVFVTHDIDEAVLVGTRLLLLSAHPARVIGTMDVSSPGMEDTSSPAFQAIAGDVRRVLFDGLATHV